MRSAAFFTVLGLFPVLISGFPFLRRDANDTDTSSNSTSTVPINGAGEPVNITGVIVPSRLNSTDSSSNSTLSTGLQLMTVNLLTMKAFYERAGVISQGLGDTNTSAILGAGSLLNDHQLSLLNNSANDVACVLDLRTVLDTTNTKNLIAAVVYLETIKLMGAASLLNNASLEIGQAQQDLLTGIYEDALQLSALAGNISEPTVPLGNYPNISQEDYASLLFKFTPSCRDAFGLQNVTSHEERGFSLPYVVSSNFVIGIDNQSCSNSSAPAFCQMIGSGVNSTAVVAPISNKSCNMQNVALGPNLLFVTQLDQPLSSDPVQRQAQDGAVCTGPEVFFVNPNP